MTGFTGSPPVQGTQRFIAMQRLAMGLLFCATFLSAITLTPELPGVGTKLIAADIFFGLFLLLTLVAAVGSKRIGAPLSGQQRLCLWLFAAFIFGLMLSLTLVGVPSGSSFGIGVLTTANYIYGMAIAVALIYWAVRFRDMETIAFAIVAGTFLVSFVAALALLGLAPAWATSGYRISSTMLTTNQVQSYVAPGMALATTFFITDRARPAMRALALVTIILGMVALLATGSRSSFIFLILLLAFFAVRVIFSRLTSVWLKLGVISISLGIGLATVALIGAVVTFGRTALPEGPMRVAARPIIEFVEMGEQQDTLESLGPRGKQIALVEQHWWESPVIGYGPDALRQYFDHRHEVHNTYLGILIDQGLVGLALLMAILVVSAVGLLRRVQSLPNPQAAQFLLGVLMALVMIYLYGLFTFGLRQRIFWLVQGLAIAGLVQGVQASRRRAVPTPTPYHTRTARLGLANTI